LLVTEHSRVSRSPDPGKRGLIMGILKDNEIQVCSPREGKLDMASFSGELVTTIKLLMASEERKEIVGRFVRGRKSKLRNGQYCLGAHQVHYGLTKSTKGRGKNIVHEVIVHKEEAAILRTLYGLIVNEGLSLNACCRYLNDRKIKTRRGKKWRVGGLSVILNNEALGTGIVHTNRYIYITEKSPRTGKPIQKFMGERPRDEWVDVEVPTIFTEQEYAT
jgi:DNA invertase Pin-like site-specific DNA recombinase